MKIIKIIILFFLFSFHLLFSQTNNKEFKEKVFIDYQNAKKLLSDEKLGWKRKDEIAQEFIDKYGEDNFYSAELLNYVVRRCIKNGKMGFCYLDGEQYIEPRYDYVGPFHNGFAMVKKSGKWGGIDKKGIEKIEIKYDKKEAKEIIDKLRKNHIKNPYIDNIRTRYENREISKDDYIMINLGGKVGFIDKYGKELIPQKYDASFGFVGELAAVKLNGKWGFIDKKDKVVVPFKYDEVDLFYEGLARAKLNGKWGFIDTKGKEVIEFKYDYVNGFSDGVAMVELNGKVGFIDKTGVLKIPLKYDWGSSFYYGIAEIKIKDKVGYVDLWGNEIFN
ncbi:MAG: WG repeat-containing protein [Elusimicrobiota bacterium]